MTFRALADRNQIDILRITGRRFQMDLVQNRAPAHGYLLGEEPVLKNGVHGQAQEQILLDLIELRPRHIILVRQDILYC